MQIRSGVILEPADEIVGPATAFECIIAAEAALGAIFDRFARLQNPRGA
jgi:hypothetical protein